MTPKALLLSSCSELLRRTTRRSCELLDQASADHIVEFVLARMNDDGGFRGRTEASDLYYTMFAVDCLQALGRALPSCEIDDFLEIYKDGDGLDLVHLSCLARCLARLPETTQHRERGRAVLRRINHLRVAGGGYRLSAETDDDSIYASFMAVLAHEEISFEIPDTDGIIHCVTRLRADDGSYGDQPGLSTGTTTVTAAALALLARFGAARDTIAESWLLARCGRLGGFHATQSTPGPDLLSTATALFALCISGRSLPPIEQQVLGFVEALWDEDGGFTGHPLDTESDCEYTYYGLLSLGAVRGNA